MAAARARIHEIARELPADNRYSSQYEAETQGRIEPNDFASAHAAYDAQGYGAPRHHDAYDQLPSLDHQQQYEEHYSHQDPMTELRPAYDEILQRHEQRGSDRPLSEDDGSGKYARPRAHQEPATYNSNSFDAAAYEANYPKAPPQEPSYVGRGESFRQASSNPAKSDEFQRDELPRERSSYPHDREPRRNERSFRRDERRDEQRANSYQPPRTAPRDETHAEGSTANRNGADRETDASNWPEPQIPAAARVPSELSVPDNFVVGVQPIRTPNTPSMGALYPQPMAIIASPNMLATSQPSNRSMSPAYAANLPQNTMGATPQAMGGGTPMMPQISMPPMMSPLSQQGAMMNQMHMRPHTSMRPGGHTPQLTEVEEAQQGSKVGRFAWFVFGAAFGIFFAFAATGFGFGKKDDAAMSFPPPAQLPVQVQAPASTQVQVQQLPPIGMQPPIMLQPQQAPMMQAVPQPPAGVTGTPAQQFAPIAPAPQPQVQPVRPPQNQGTVRVRTPAPPPPPPPPPRARRPVAQPSNDDAPSAPAQKPAGGEPNVNDLLNAGLGG